MGDLGVLLLFALPIAAAIGFILIRKRVRRAERTASTCGKTPSPGGTVDTRRIYIGPELWDGDRSPGVPTHPQAHPGGGFAFDVPTGDGEKVDYVTFNHGSLAGHDRIRVKGRIEMAEGTELLAVPERDLAGRYPAQITMYFQREGDNWSAKGDYEDDRWYATFVRQRLQAGDFEMIAPLDGPWTATQRSSNDPNAELPLVYNPAGFRDAITHACCVGFVFGGNDIGFGHGMKATGPARFIVTELAVE